MCTLVQLQKTDYWFAVFVTKLLQFTVRFNAEDICRKNDRIEQNIELNNVLFETLFSMANIL